MMNLTDLKQTIQQQADQCVKCGLCLPHCPTYVATENECESPRGRIALMAGLATDALPLDKKTQTYLNHCLTCRACELVCPAQVTYGKLIDETRFLMQQNKSSTRLPRSIDFMIRHPWALRLASHLFWFYQRVGLQYLVRKSRLLKLLRLDAYDALLPTLTKPHSWSTYYPASATQRGEVALFTGCISNAVDQKTLSAAITVLTKCGYGVHVPKQQVCCGAMHLHAGIADVAEQLAHINKSAFQDLKLDAIITIASGCGATLKEYAEPLSTKVIDINQFLTEIEWPVDLVLKSLPQHVAVHTPCTLRNILKQASAPIKLLAKIPDIKLIEFSSKSFCCGAAGVYMLQYQDMAQQLAETTLAPLLQFNPDWIVSSNIGCQLHLSKILREKNGRVNFVVHPVELVAAQMN